MRIRSQAGLFLLFSAWLLLPAAQAQSTTRVSVSSTGAEASNYSQLPCMTPDGRFVAFGSAAANLVPGDTNGQMDIFVVDRQLGTIERASVDSSGIEGDGTSIAAAVSADGRFVAFQSGATNFYPGAPINHWQIYVHDRSGGTTEIISTDSTGVPGNHHSEWPSISADGRFVVFRSYASNLVAGDTNAAPDIFMRDRQTGAIERVSVDAAGAQANGPSHMASISGDGRWIAFSCGASNLVAGDSNNTADVFVRDLQTGTVELVSVDSTGTPVNLGGLSWTNAISADGRCVIFWSSAPNLVAGDINGVVDVFLRDRQAGTTECVSVDSAGSFANDHSYSGAISSDGRFVTFSTYANNLVPGENANSMDVFVHDRQTGTTERVSVDSSWGEVHGGSTDSSISSDGRFVAFSSVAVDLVPGDTNGKVDIFLRDRLSQPAGFCFGDGTACPCANNGLPGHGCENSSYSGGAVLSSSGTPSLSADTLVLSSSGELPGVLSIFLQGTLSVSATSFGDGLRCVGGLVKRLYIRHAVGGVAVAPPPGGPSISARSSALGDPLDMGSSRYYQTYYRDPALAFCPRPAGDGWNISSGLVALWGP